MEETGACLNHIEDEDEWKEAWLEWVQDKIPEHIR